MMNDDELRCAQRALANIRKEVTDPAAQDPDVWNTAYLKGWHTIADHVLLILDNYEHSWHAIQAKAAEAVDGPRPGWTTTAEMDRKARRELSGVRAEGGEAE